MVYSEDMRWRAITLIYAYSIPAEDVATLFGVNSRTVRRWCSRFEATGTVLYKGRQSDQKQSRYPERVLHFLRSFVKEHPCFYIEEIQAELKLSFPDIKNLSASTICRALKFNLQLTRKVIEKRA